ncbi:hypothetical protein C4D60_Mb06t07690 [Musa balbisiana]|uniref:Importin N-terminal domain-containing protein n=1 Tax=Musa balbisiana TaxID=52838 RepID=A0A4S8ILI7_MUSBA|nr:hypothetical protein C4D60_Mb06t07690 [Musa balbisiana]
MDLAGLTVVLRAALSPIPDERKAAEESLNQFQYTPLHMVRLLQIVVDGTCDMGVRQVASIHFKNFVAKNWSPDEPGEPQKVLETDKSMVRENILGFVAQVPPLLRFKSDEERIPLYAVVEETFPLLLNLEIPRQLFDPNVFGAWMALFLNILERPVPLEGQPSDPELLNAIRIGEYLPDRVTNLILQYLSSSISKTSMYQLLQPQLDIVLFEIVFPLMCFNDNDQKLWSEDPHEYVRKGYDIIEDLYSPRTAAMDFVSELVRKRGKENFQKFIHFIVDIFTRYNEASVEFKPYRQKDGALLAIGTLCDKLKQTEPYKSGLERMLVQHVLPEFTSPIGHLRAKRRGKRQEETVEKRRRIKRWIRRILGMRPVASNGWTSGEGWAQIGVVQLLTEHCTSGATKPEALNIGDIILVAAWVAGQYAHINFLDQNNFRSVFHCVVSGLRDPELPVRVDSVFALRSFVEACKEFFKLMNEVENEDLVFTLETIVDKFGEEMAPYAFGLCQNLAAAFWRCLDASESDDEADDAGALAAVGCLRAISTILESVSGLPHLFVQVEPTLLPIMRKMLTTDGQDVFEEVLEIVSYMTFYSPTISLEMWSLWPLIMDALGDWAIDFFDSQVDHWVEPYLRITIERLRQAERSYLKCLLMLVIADALYYNSSLTLRILHKLGVATEVFNLWFQMLQEVKKSGMRANFKREHDKKVCCLGLTSLLGLPADQLPGEAFERVFKATLELLVSYKEQVAAVQASDPARFQNLTRTLDFHYQALASGVAQHAEQRRVEIEKEKLEKAATQ